MFRLRGSGRSAMFSERALGVVLGLRPAMVPIAGCGGLGTGVLPPTMRDLCQTVRPTANAPYRYAAPADEATPLSASQLHTVFAPSTSPSHACWRKATGTPRQSTPPATSSFVQNAGNHSNPLARDLKPRGRKKTSPPPPRPLPARLAGEQVQREIRRLTPSQTPASSTGR